MAKKVTTDLDVILEKVTKVKGKRFATALQKIIDLHPKADKFQISDMIPFEAKKVGIPGKTIEFYSSTDTYVYVNLGTASNLRFNHNNEADDKGE